MKRQPALRIFMTILVGLGLVLWQRAGAKTPATALLEKTVMPTASIFTRAGVEAGDLLSLVASIKNLAKENEDLRRENHELRGRLVQAEEQLVHLEGLKRELSFEGLEQYRLVAARVVSYQPDSLRQYVLIRAGSRQGLRVGMEVVSQGHLVGRLSEVTAESSKVFLVTDPNFKIGAINQQSRASGTVRGQIGTGIIMEKIAQTDSVKVGDKVITDSSEAEGTQGILIGEIEKVQQQDNAVFQTATVTSPVNFNRLEQVMVVVK